MGSAIQVLMALFILKTAIGVEIFDWLGKMVTKLLGFADKGAEFVFGPLAKQLVLEGAFGSENTFIFFFKLIPTVIFVSVLVSVAYHIGLMQMVVAVFAKAVHRLMGASGSEALSNVSSIFVGQVEAQIMIKPYLPGMTMSELLASMAGSMACIAGGVMAVYISMGVPAEYLLTASLMAAPGALVISKIIYPETAVSETKGAVKLEVKKMHANIMDAISHGASDGLKVSFNVVAMLIGFLAILALIDALLGKVGFLLGYYARIDFSMIGIDIMKLSLKEILGSVFSLLAYAMGVPWEDIHKAGALMGTKIVANEFVAYVDLTKMISAKELAPKSIMITSFALCGFANFSSIAIQIGGIGELAPSRRKDLAKLGFKALIAGTLASYMSATLAGIVM